MGHFAASVLNNPVLLGIMSFGLIGVPIIGMWAAQIQLATLGTI
jgi:hypothetical protein